MIGRILLVRHPPVARRWDGRCYGSSDMGWSRAGLAMAHALAATLANEHAAIVVHSGLRRTERLARMIVAHADGRLLCDPRWRERDFGAWEGRSWQSIWRETGDLMDRMTTHPTDFRPGGGETTAELFRRAGDAWAELPRRETVIVVAHGGSIAAARARHADRPVSQLVDFIPAPGTVCVTGWPPL